MTIQAILCDIPPSLLHADNLLTEYGRWATTFSKRGGGEPTLERRFRRHLDRHESLAAFEARRIPSNPLMPMQEALLCQRALSRVPDRERIVLSILYVRARWFSAHQELRLLRIPPQLSRIRHEAGLRMFDNLHRMLSVQARHKPVLVKPARLQWLDGGGLLPDDCQGFADAVKAMAQEGAAEELAAGSAAE